MRILVVHPRMSVRGGGERVAVHTVVALKRVGHEVSLASEEFDVAAFEDFFGSRATFDGVTQLSYPPFSPTVKGRFLLYQRVRYHQRRLSRVLSNAGSFDLVVSTQDIGYVPSVRSKTVQYCYFPEYFAHLESSPSSPWWNLYYWPVSRFYRERVGRVDVLLSVSEFTRGFVRSKWGRDSVTLYPPCPVDLYAMPSGPREDLVITIGRIVPEKRMDLFVNLAARLPHYKFALIGSLDPERTPYFEQLKKHAPENLSFILSPLRKVKDLLARAKAYVHSAVNEHFGISIVEAMAAGCVPVVHDSGGPREIVSDKVGFRWANIQQAAGQISELIENERLREKLSDNAIARAREFRPEVFENGLLAVLRDPNLTLTPRT